MLKVGCASIYSGVEFGVHISSSYEEKQLFVGMCFMSLRGMSHVTHSVGTVVHLYCVTCHMSHIVLALLSICIAWHVTCHT